MFNTARINRAGGDARGVDRHRRGHGRGRVFPGWGASVAPGVSRRALRPISTWTSTTPMVELVGRLLKVYNNNVLIKPLC